jgi:hypothetical protein
MNTTILKLMKKEREIKEEVSFDKSHRWNQVLFIYFLIDFQIKI